MSKLSSSVFDMNITLSSPRPSSGQDPDTPLLIASRIPKDIPANHVLIKVDRFGFSANNVTYQALGEHPHFRWVDVRSGLPKQFLIIKIYYAVRYFDFHPAPESEDGKISSKTHALIPVWGFGTVVKSSHPKIKDGERVYGYLVPTRYLLLQVSPSDVNKVAFYVPRPHLPAGTCYATPPHDVHPSLTSSQIEDPTIKS